MTHGTMDRDARLKRLRFRASHRGTREADMMIGDFCASHCESWSEAEMDWFETLLEEQDVDIMAWAIGTAPPPKRFESRMMERFRALNYIKHHE
jgi:antitoxin CptB